MIIDPKVAFSILMLLNFFQLLLAVALVQITRNKFQRQIMTAYLWGELGILAVLLGYGIILIGVPGELKNIIETSWLTVRWLCLTGVGTLVLIHLFGLIVPWLVNPGVTNNKRFH